MAFGRLNSALALLSAAVMWICGVALGVAQAQDTGSSQGHDFQVETLATGLRFPWGLAFLPDGRMLVTERTGSLRAIAADGTISPALEGVPRVAVLGQGGLLDVALHPKFASNKLIYLSYAEPGGGGAGTAVARARLGEGRLEDLQVLFRQKPKLFGGRHFGSRLQFLPDGTLLISMGDRAQRRRAQDLGNHQGTIARIADDGAVPEDNPFVASAGALPEIYSYGHRNIHGLARDPETGVIWSHEYGALGGDELNVVRAGANYGWPTITYSREYSGGRISRLTEQAGMEQPVVYWTPSISPSGLAVYRGDKFPNWRGDLFVGALTPGHVRHLKMQNGRVVEQNVLLPRLASRIRDVRTSPDGYLYVLTDSRNGKLIRLVPR